MLKKLIAVVIGLTAVTVASAMGCNECKAEYDKNYRACRGDATCQTRAADAYRDCRKGCNG